jgi:hypothetical protein
MRNASKSDLNIDQDNLSISTFPCVNYDFCGERATHVVFGRFKSKSFYCYNCGKILNVNGAGEETNDYKVYKLVDLCKYDCLECRFVESNDSSISFCELGMQQKGNVKEIVQKDHDIKPEYIIFAGNSETRQVRPVNTGETMITEWEIKDNEEFDFKGFVREFKTHYKLTKKIIENTHDAIIFEKIFEYVSVVRELEFSNLTKLANFIDRVYHLVEGLPRPIYTMEEFF